MVSYLFLRVWRHSWLYVLILIVVDDGLVRDDYYDLYPAMVVLILIVVEDGLVPM